MKEGILAHAEQKKKTKKKQVEKEMGKPREIVVRKPKKENNFK